MKSLIIPLLFLTATAHAQKGVESENWRTLHLGNNNRLFVAAEKSKPGSILLGTDNGTIVKDTTQPGVFFAKPERVGKAVIVITQWYTKQVSHNDSLVYEVVEK